MSLEPYWSDGRVSLYLGDCRELLPALGVTADLVLADPPYGETSLPWDRWQTGWLEVAASVAPSLWCFGSLRTFMAHASEFADGGWKLSQDVIWEKHNGSSFHTDRFRCVHEIGAHWYQGAWADTYREPLTTPDAVAKTVRRKARPPHLGHIERSSYVSEDGGPRMMRSVIQFPSMHGRAIHPTEKPVGVLDLLIRYACPPDGLVIDPFAGSAAALDAARCVGRRAVGIEADERYLELAARRLSQADLFGGAA